MSDGEPAASQYDAIAAAYSAHNADSAFNAFYERPATIALLGDVGNRRVLEIGCGPGALTSWLVDHGAAVTAVDVSTQMVSLAKARVGDRAKILRADVAEPLSFTATASTDLVVASLVLHYVAAWEPVLQEFHRVLAPGGAVVFSTHHPAMDWQFYSPENYFALKRVTEIWTIGGKPFEVSFWRRPLTAMTAAIASSGFVIEQLVEPEPLPELRQRDPEADETIRTGPRFLFFRLGLRG